MNVDDLIDAILVREGGYVNHPADRGGPTNYGITLATLRAWRGDPSLDAESVKALTETEARAVYRQRYVVDPGFERLEDKRLAAHLVDWGVNSGPRRAIKALQRVLEVTVDGALGPKTAAKANAHAGVPAFARVLRQELVAARLRFYARIVKRDPTQAAFIEGWVNRALEFLE